MAKTENKNVLNPPSVLLVQEALKASGLDLKGFAQYLGTSYYTVSRWKRGDIEPGAESIARLQKILTDVKAGHLINGSSLNTNGAFASRGARRSPQTEMYTGTIHTLDKPGPDLVNRLKTGSLWGKGQTQLATILAEHENAAQTIQNAAAEGVSAGKNTYTYDAHTYHTKVPPQGIAQVLLKYLPEGGLVLDPFAGSGMTGVAALTTGHDVILNELSPAASFIADRFTSQCDATVLGAAVKLIIDNLADLRKKLYTTQCRTCGEDTELLFTVWSYKVICSECNHEFVLWNECRSYGKTVREHKFLKEFPCPHCKQLIKKSRLARTAAVPVLVGYKCCGKTQSEVEPSEADIERISAIENKSLVDMGFVPDVDLPDGVNLSQPKRRGLANFKDFYTARNLAAMSHIWKEIHKVEDTDIAAFLAFIFTSLYQRVTKLSEYRFWGGSGNTANFNVPYIFNEANVFATFIRKARSVFDHLQTTATHYNSKCLVNTGSATNISILPDCSVDMIFTDPPFGANINYSEMNMLWESWLKTYTDNTNEAIVSRAQKKDANKYQDLMTQSLSECYRTLRPGHWLVLVFMNSAKDIWERVRNAIINAGFSIERIDIFDKQHGTFKQFVSDNTAGSDLMLHCRKPLVVTTPVETVKTVEIITVKEFIGKRKGNIPVTPYLHVNRPDDIDYRTRYSEFLAESLLKNRKVMDFTSFRDEALKLLEKNGEI